MTGFDPLIRFFKTLDETAERVERTWWGTVATDSRFPRIWDANYASVENTESDVSLSDVESALVPAVKQAGVGFVHVVVFHPGDSRVLSEAEARGDRIHVDTVMQHIGSVPDLKGEHLVREATEQGDRFWERIGRGLREFDVTQPEVIEEMVRREREVLTPFGKRWFTVGLDGEIAGFGALYVLEGVGYVDNVVTFPESRRQGIGGAIVSCIVEKARAAGARLVYLLADEPGPIRLYERLGFNDVGRIASFLRPL